MFSNHYLDALFKPQWERFGIDFDSKKINGNHKNGKSEDLLKYGVEVRRDKDHKSSTSACCVIV